MARTRYAALLALPGVLLALVATTHPARLNPDTAHHWWVMHIVLIPIFPFVGVALWWLVKGRRDVVAGLAFVLAVGYASGYTALDILAGVGAGYATDTVPGPRSPAVLAVFEIGDALGLVGAYCLLALGALVGATLTVEHLFRRSGGVAVVGSLIATAVLVVAGISFLDSHIYRWRGVLTVLAVGLATGVLALLSRSSSTVEAVHRPATSVP